MLEGNSYGENMLDFGTGDRVELHPSIPAWKRGERFGVVLQWRRYVAPTLVRVKLDSGRIMQVPPRLLRLVS